MLRKIINILLLIPYIGFGAGITVTVHTCKYEQSMKAMKTDSDMCDCSGHAANACCNTEIKTQKVNDAQSVTAVHDESNLVVTGTVVPDDFFADTIADFFVTDFFDTSPPSPQDIYLSNSVFRI